MSTDEKGRFTVPGKAYHDGQWRVAVQGGTYSDYAATAGPSDYVDVRYLTAISDYFAAPDPVRKSATVTVQGMLGGRPGDRSRLARRRRNASATPRTARRRPEGDAP